MKISQLFKAVIEIGREADPRSPEEVTRELERLSKQYAELSPVKQKLFDQERLSNPYADTRILTGDPGKEVRNIMVGIDIDVGEVLLADRLREKGRKIDLLLSHHPAGKAYAGFYNVIHMQADILHRFGVPINVAEALLDERVTEVERKTMPANFSRAVDAARALELAFICAHTPADNCVVSYLQSLLDEKQPARVSEIIDIIIEIPEYREAIRDNAPPRQVAGKGKARPGKIFVDMTGGTEGPKEILTSLARAGVGTLVCMHLSPDRIQKAKENKLNVVLAGHISSDNLGVNLLLDRLIEKEPLEIIPCSGFRRISRH